MATRPRRRPPPGRTASGTRKTRALQKKVQKAAEVIAENLEARKTGKAFKFHDGFCHLAEQTAIINATGYDFANLFGVSMSAVEEWLRENPRFKKAVERGVEFADNQVEAALAHRARGYTHPEEQIFYDGKKPLAQRVVRVPTVKHYPPDTAAAYIWLKNRRSSKWKDRQPEGEEGDAPPPVRISIEFKDARRVDDDLLKGG